MSKKYLLTAFCKDRPGIVADISEVIYENHCNLEDSTMTNLAGEFAIILLFSPLTPSEEAGLEEKFSTECRRLEREKGITAFIRPVNLTENNLKTDCYVKSLHVEGMDQAGIVYKVSRFLADSGINITSLNSSMKSSPESGAAIYSLSLWVEIPKNLLMETVEHGLDQIEDDLNVDITLE